VAFEISCASAQMQYPLAVAATNDGTVFVGDRHLPGIWKIEGSEWTLFFQGSTTFRTPLNAVRCLAVDRAGALLAGDSATRDVYRFDNAAKSTPLTDGGIGIPMSIAVNSQGELLVADLELHRIWRVAAAGGEPELFAEVPAPRGVSIDAQDNLWVVSHGQDQLLRIAPDGTQTRVIEGRPFKFPNDVLLAADGTAFVSDGYGKTIWRVSADGKPIEFASGAPLVNPVGLAWRGENLLVADPHAKAVFAIAPDGKFTTLGPKAEE
ncbi:MAG: SMP-30/gluconolactonase/LRE family protein, partial [Planctomycetes bacterium]|nr:SMP-30/gluconolactonase/LRE family protein [Planctomycetota bacterium]